MNLQALLDNVVQDAQSGDGSLCYLLENTNDCQQWLEFDRDFINLAYPFADDPVPRLQALHVDFPTTWEVATWEPHSHATVRYSPHPLPAAEELIRRYFQEIFQLNILTDPINISERNL